MTTASRVRGPAESATATLARHVRHVAADPLLAGYHRDREARVLEQAATRLAAEGDPECGEMLRELAAAHRAGTAAAGTTR